MLINIILCIGHIAQNRLWIPCWQRRKALETIARVAVAVDHVWRVDIDNDAANSWESL